MRVVHDAGESTETLASDVELAESLGSHVKGLMFRRAIPEDYAMVFEFDGVRSRGVHTVFVRFPIDVVWVADGEVDRVATLPAWRGLASGTGDRIVELPAGAADSVERGDTIRVVD